MREQWPSSHTARAGADQSGKPCDLKRIKPLATLGKTQRLPDRPQMIIEAAIPIIGQRGYYGFSIKDIAERCGVTMQGVLHHFGSKEGILHAIMEDRERRDAEAVWGDVLSDDLSGIARLEIENIKRRLHDTVVRNSQQPDVLRLYSMLRTESLYPEHPAHKEFQGRIAAAIELFTNAFTGKLANPASMARQILATMSGLEDLWLETGMGFDLVEEWDRAIDMILV
jgi:AcrR family transcriptional regulator